MVWPCLGKVSWCEARPYSVGGGGTIQPLGHVVASAAGGAVCYGVTRSASAGFVFFVVGVFMDLDHLFDYVRLFFSRPFSRSVFLDMPAHMKSRQRIYLILHGYEVVVLVWLGLAALGYSSMGTVVAASMLLHLLIDQCMNETTLFAYFLLYRISKGFQVEHIFPRSTRGN